MQHITITISVGLFFYCIGILMILSVVTSNMERIITKQIVWRQDRRKRTGVYMKRYHYATL